jgi:hypothetical protein
LVEGRVPENSQLVYQEFPADGREESINEILLSIASLANADGGYLIVGISKDVANRAMKLSLIKGINEKARLIQQACINWINEPINGLEVCTIESGTDQGVVVVCIPASSLRPHMIVRENRTDFYRRYGTAQQTMTLDEIRSMILTNPANQRLIEDQLLASGKLVYPGRSKKANGVPYARVFTEKSVEQFLHKYMCCTAFPQTLVIVSPFISDLAGELIDLEDIVDKINRDKTLTYVITSPTKEIYQQESLAVLQKSPFIEIRHNKDIHAKLYLCWCRKKEEESFAMFGSGNLTRGGIRHNLELGMMIYANDHGRKLIRELYQWSTVGLRSQSQRIKAATRR